MEKVDDAHHLRYGLNMEFGVFKFEPFLESIHDDPCWDALLNKWEMQH
jgi:hypothetical protein